jgi:hypothetical protein
VSVLVGVLLQRFIEVTLPDKRSNTSPNERGEIVLVELAPATVTHRVEVIRHRPIVGTA